MDLEGRFVDTAQVFREQGANRMLTKGYCLLVLQIHQEVCRSVSVYLSTMQGSCQQEKAHAKQLRMPDCRSLTLASSSSKRCKFQKGVWLSYLALPLSARHAGSSRLACIKW